MYQHCCVISSLNELNATILYLSFLAEFPGKICYRTVLYHNYLTQWCAAVHGSNRAVSPGYYAPKPPDPVVKVYIIIQPFVYLDLMLL